MADIGKQKQVQTADAAGITPRPPVVRLRLATVRDCRRELARLYVEARRGEIEPATATRLCFLLNALVGMIRDSDLEGRIAALEKELNR
jgi:hypothetical protein